MTCSAATAGSPASAAPRSRPTSVPSAATTSPNHTVRRPTAHRPRRQARHAGGDDIAALGVAGAQDPGLLALGLQAVGEPVGLAGDVVVDLGEAELFEPARGSGAHVSQRVMAVHDHRPVGVEPGGAGGVELLEGDVDRAGQVLVGVLGCRQHLHQLRATLTQLLELLQIDPGRHVATEALWFNPVAAVAFDRARHRQLRFGEIS
jgi:hypothetical protein